MQNTVLEVTKSVLLWVFGTLAVFTLLFGIPKVSMVDEWDAPYRASLWEVWKASAPDSFSCQTPAELASPRCSQLAKFLEARFSTDGETEISIRVTMALLASLAFCFFAWANYVAARRGGTGVFFAVHHTPTWATFTLYAGLLLAFAYVAESVAL